MTIRSLAICILAIPLPVSFAQSPSPSASATAAPSPSASATPWQLPVLSSDVPIPVTGIVVPLWPDGKMPGSGAALPESHNAPKKPGAELIITNVSQPTIEVFKAPNATGPVSAAIICPGGGYGIVDYNTEGTLVAKWLNSLGITGVYLKYRVPKNRDGAFQDAQRAVRLVRSHAAEWGIQPDKVGLVGFSAGGNLAARLSTNFDKVAYPPVDQVDQINVRPDFVILTYPAYLNAGRKLSPDIVIRQDVPPTLMVHTEDDPNYLGGTRLYDAALTGANIPHTFLLYKKGGHGYGVHSNLDVKVWPAQAADWLRKIGILPPAPTVTPARSAGS